MWPRGKTATQHPAAKLLTILSEMGCPVDTGPDWSEEEILAALARGPHVSAKITEALQCLHIETEEKLKGGYVTKQRWGDIKHNYPKNLKLSPLAMIPHKSRKYRCILDLSFQLKLNGKKIDSVNQTTTGVAPQKAMAQLGATMKRILHNMATNYNKDKPFKFSKCDIKDGFWRLVVSMLDAWNFCYVLPSKQLLTNIDDLEIIVPHALQMGWSESPPLFCTATETARYIIQSYFDNETCIPPHPFEHYLHKNITMESKQYNNKNNATTLIEVYVDDFVTATNDTSNEHLQHLSRAILHGIHSIFPPPSVTKHSGQDPISEKKLKQNEGLFEHVKEILGWIVDGKEFTIQLPQQKAEKILGKIRKLLKQQKIPLQKLQKMQGKLIHASLGMPGGKGLMSPIYSATKSNPTSVKMTTNLKQCLKDWKEIIKHLAARPTSVLELAPDDPKYIGYVDASGTAVGGVWVDGTKSLQHQWVWRLKWPQEVQDQLITENNKHGTLSINDLEMAGILLAWLVLEDINAGNLQNTHIGMFCDNMSTVTWTNKKSTSTSTIAGHLLRALALRQHICRASPLLTVHIAGKQNKMADVASRSFNDVSFTNTDKTFLQTFTSLFPIQNKF